MDGGREGGRDGWMDGVLFIGGLKLFLKSIRVSVLNMVLLSAEATFMYPACTLACSRAISKSHPDNNPGALA